MKKIMGKPVIAAVLAASLLLAGCGRGTDMPRKYKDYLYRTFGGNYTVKEADGGKSYREWTVTYTDVSGRERTTSLYSYNMDDSDMELYGSQEAFDDIEIYSFSLMEISQIVSYELYERFVADRFDFPAPDNSNGLVSMNDKGETLGFGIIVPNFTTNSKSLDYARQQISAEDGIKISEYDLKQAAQNPYMSIFFNITLNSTADAQECTEKMEEIYSEFLTYTESPQNYRFNLIQRSDEEDGNNTVLFSKSVILGEEIDEDAMEKDGSKFLYSSELDKKLFGEE